MALKDCLDPRQHSHANTYTHLGNKQVTIYACREFAEGRTGVFVDMCVGGRARCVLVRLMFPALSEAISPLTQIGASTEAKIVRQ